MKASTLLNGLQRSGQQNAPPRAETGRPTKTDFPTTNIHFAVTVVGQVRRASEGRLLARLSGRVADQEVVRRLDATVIDAALDLEQPSFAPAGTPGIPEQPFAQTNLARIDRSAYCRIVGLDLSEHGEINWLGTLEDLPVVDASLDPPANDHDRVQLRPRRLARTRVNPAFVPPQVRVHSDGNGKRPRCHTRLHLQVSMT